VVSTLLVSVEVKVPPWTVSGTVKVPKGVTAVDDEPAGAETDVELVIVPELTEVEMEVDDAEELKGVDAEPTVERVLFGGLSASVAVKVRIDEISQ
jgi:hypothetical protein